MSRRNDQPAGAASDAQRSPLVRIRPALVPGIVVLFTLIATLIYAGPGARLVALTLTSNGILLGGWLLSAAGWGAGPARYLARGGNATKLFRATTAVAIGLGILGLLTLFLGLAGLISSTAAWVILGVGWILGLVNWQRHRTRQPRPPSTPANRDRAAWLWLLIVPVLSAALVATMVPPGLLWKPEEPHGYDVVEYHLQIPREWMEAGRITPLEHNVFSYFPFGVEMHYLLAMEMTGGAWPGMYLSQLMHFAMMALAMAAALGAAMSLSAHRRVALLASIAGVTAPWIAQLSPIAFNEGGLLLYGTLCIGWTLLSLRRTCEGPASPLRGFMLAGAMAGLACGVKLTAGPLLLAAVPVVVLMTTYRESRRRQLVYGLIAFGLAGAVVFSPWLIRNVVWAGNPVFPEGTSLFGKAHFDEAQAERWSRAHHPQPDQQSIAARWAAFYLEVLGNWQFGFVLLPLAMIALALSWRHREAQFFAALLVLHVIFWIAFTHLQGRFFVLSIPIAVLAIATARWDRLPQRPGFIALTLAVAIAAAIGWGNIHRRLTYKLYEQAGSGIAALLADDKIDWMTAPFMENFPLSDSSAKLLLVGDAQAFAYPLPMSRLRYRTVFDVHGSSNDSLLSAYVGDHPPANEWRLIDSAELWRFQKTYQPFPSIGAAERNSPLWNENEPKLIAPGK